MSGGSLGKISTFVPFIYTCFADAGPCALLVSGFENVFQKKKKIKIIHKKRQKIASEKETEGDRDGHGTSFSDLNLRSPRPLLLRLIPDTKGTLEASPGVAGAAKGKKIRPKSGKFGSAEKPCSSSSRGASSVSLSLGWLPSVGSKF